jgi:Calpain family cysteine protease
MRTAPDAGLRERVLALQASAGNAAVVRMLARRATRRAVHAGDTSLTEAAVEGGTTFVRGEGDTHAVDPNDVVQGALNDCFVLAPMISIARFNPEHVMRLIRPTRGGWMVSLYRPTWWWHDLFTIFVDNRFWLRGGRPIYAQTADAITGNIEMWPMILEKAVAIARGGSYSNVDWGSTAEVTSMLTGKGTTAHRLPSRDTGDILDDFVRARNRGYAAVCNTKETYSGAAQTLAQNLGVISKHSYAFVGVNRQAQTVSLRDPNNVAHLPNLSIANLKALFEWAIFSDGYQ